MLPMPFRPPRWCRTSSDRYGRDPETEKRDIALYRFDLRSHRTGRVPGSDGLYAPIWSPNGSQLAALSVNSDQVKVDLKSGQRAVLTRRKADYAAWSSDSRYIYFNSLMTDQPAVFRVYINGGKEEKITDILFQTTGIYGMWTGLTLDDSVLVIRGHHQGDVYALTLASD